MGGSWALTYVLIRKVLFLSNFGLNVATYVALVQRWAVVSVVC